MIIGEFCDVYPPQLDGVGMVVDAYCTTFERLGDVCYYIAPDAPDDTPRDYHVLTYDSIRLPKEAYHFGLPESDFAFQKALRGVELDIVHAHSPFFAGRFGASVAFRRRVPLIATFHSKYYDDFLKKTGSETLAKLGVKYIVGFYEKCDEVWAVNEATGQVLSDYGYMGEIQIMPNGTNLWYPTDADRRAAEERFGLAGKQVFLFVGQHNFKKNTRHILEAIKLYAKDHDDFRMIFAGQGPDAEAMKKYAKKLGVDGVTDFVGHIMDRQVIMGLYARADLLVFPSLYDNAPMVVREAAAAGTPALLIRGSCAAEGVSDGVNGFLCGDTPEEIAACMARAKTEGETVGEKARETIPLAWDTVIRQARERYEALAEKYRTGELSRKSDWFYNLTDRASEWFKTLDF